jgi:hypothetical protein
MLEACREPDPALNPGASLGAWLAACADDDRYLLRLSLSRDVRGFGAWIEQLVAESTGKQGHGVLPLPGGVDGEGDILAARLRHCAVAGVATFAHPDDGFVLRCQSAEVPDHTVVMPEAADLWGEVVRWEFATAACGFLLGINPFDEPDVSSAKAATQAILSGSAQAPSGVRHLEIPSPSALTAALAPDLAQLGADDYVAVLAYLPPTPSQLQRLDALKTALQSKTAAAVTVQIGPRYLHSTGQLHKGGPARGLFVVLTDLHRTGLGDVAVPGATYTFGELARAQCDGDVWVLQQRGKAVVVADLTA